jgi:hypothetical protein
MLTRSAEGDGDARRDRGGAVHWLDSNAGCDLRFARCPQWFRSGSFTLQELLHAILF